MLNDIKDKIYVFFKNSMAVLYPAHFPLDSDGFSEKVFWRKSRDEQPQKPFIILDDTFKGKLNKSYERYYKDGQPVQRENWSMTITLGVYTQGTLDDDRLALDCIEAIELLFNSQETFDALEKFGIIVKEKQIGNIRELSAFEQTNYSYRYEVDVVFEFDKIITVADYGDGKAVEAEVKINNTDAIRIQETIQS